MKLTRFEAVLVLQPMEVALPAPHPQQELQLPVLHQLGSQPREPKQKKLEVGPGSGERELRGRMENLIGLFWDLNSKV